MSQLGLKLEEGRLPTAYDEIAITSYYAMCLINYGYNSDDFIVNSDNYRDLTPADLINQDQPLVLTLSDKVYRIVGIVDAGVIDKKYDGILENSANAVGSLKTDFENFIGNSFNLYGFVQDGFVENSFVENHTLLQYKNEAYEFDFDFTDKDLQYFYNYAQLEEVGGLAMFIEEGKTTLQGNEILINATTFETVYASTIERFRSIATGKKNVDDLEMLDLYLGQLTSNKTSAEEKLVVAQNIVDLLTSPGYPIKSNQLLLKTTATKRDTTKYESDGSNLLKVDLKNSAYTIVGFYTGLTPLNMDDVNAMILTEEGMSNLGINVKQGSYGSVIAQSTKSTLKINKIVNLVTRDDGLKYTCANNIITIVTINRDTLLNMSRIFLVASGVFAIFAIAMMANYISTSINNRHEQIGILRALGTTSYGVLLMFLVQSLIIAFINVALSNVLTGVCSIYLNAYLDNVLNISIPLASYTARQFFVIGGVSIAVAIVASFVPILKLSRKKPIETIRKN